MKLNLIRQINPQRLGRAANDAHFERPPAKLWDVTYQLRNGHKGSIAMVSRTMAGAMVHVINLLSDTPPRAVTATQKAVEPC